MPRWIQNTFIALSILLALCLIALRIEGQLFSPSGGIGMFSELLGYEGTRNYAVLYVPEKKPSLLFLLEATNGSVALKGAVPAATVIKNLPDQPFPQSAALIEKEIVDSRILPSVDAVAFVTAQAAGKVVDTFGGIYFNGTEVTSISLPTVLAALPNSPERIGALNNGLSLKTQNLITRGPALLSTLKNIFSQNQAAVYFMAKNPFKKPCIGACGKEVYELMQPSYTL